MWMVWDDENGLIGIFEKYEKALTEYEKCKEFCKDYLYQNGEFSGDERVVLAKLEKQFHSFDTGKPTMKEDDKGNEKPTGDTYWDWKEIKY